MGSDPLNTLCEILGLTETHLVGVPSEFYPGRFRARAGAAAALNRLVARAARAGFQLAIASAHRSYDRQLLLFNGKCLGDRPVLSESGRTLDRQAMAPEDWLAAVLRYSALPGTSRHHWGTDFDIWDRAAVSDDYALQLVPSEYERGGVFGELSAWLDEMIAADDAEGFFRPYDVDRGGVAPEPWHISYRPEAATCYDALSVSTCLPIWRGEPDPLGVCHPALVMQDAVVADADGIFERYVLGDHLSGR
jgi:LAS superfamily LD-carboxypeptidase LdcB